MYQLIRKSGRSSPNAERLQKFGSEHSSADGNVWRLMEDSCKCWHSFSGMANELMAMLAMLFQYGWQDIFNAGKAPPTCLAKVLAISSTHRLLWVPDRRKRLGGRACQLRSRWRKCWRSRRLLRRSCQMAFGRPVGCHAPSSTTPSMHCRSGLRPVQRG